MDFQDFSDPPSPIRGNFIQVSEAVTTPSQASSVASHQPQQLSPIDEKITESDEENLEELIERGKMQYQQAREAYQQAASNASTPSRRAVERDDYQSGRRSRSRSPTRPSKSNTPSRRSRSSSPVKNSTRRGHGANQPRVSFTFHDSDDEGGTRTAVNSSAASKRSRKHQDYVVSPITSASPAPSLSRRRHMPDLPPIDVTLARQEARAAALRKGHIPVAMHVPEKDTTRKVQPRNEPAPKAAVKGHHYSSSDYSQDGEGHVGRISVDPLQVSRRPPSNRTDARQSIFDTYADWKEGVNKRHSGVLPADEDEELEETFEPDYHAHKKHMDMSVRKRSPHPQVSQAQQAGYNGDHYSPLDVMFPSEQQPVPSARKASKTMIGSKGWLEDTSASPLKPPPKSNGFFENLRKKAKELVHMGNEQLKAPRHPHKSKPDSPERQLVISLNPREQSLLYCELEYVLACALNNYITCQFNAGRLVTDKLKRITDGWQARGRPRVVGFRYDLETQLDLIRAHVAEFRFYTRQPNEAAIKGILDAARVDARAMRVRTYCYPDTVVAKQILDARNLLNLLGACEEEHVALASVTQFYRDAFARETVFHYDTTSDGTTDSARLRGADGQAATITTPQTASRYNELSSQGRQSREQSSVPTASTPHTSARGRGRSPGITWPLGE